MLSDEQVVKVLRDKYGCKVDLRNLWKGHYTKKGIRLQEEAFTRFVDLLPRIQLEIKKLNKRGVKGKEAN